MCILIQFQQYIPIIDSTYQVILNTIYHDFIMINIDQVEIIPLKL